ncbi:DUF11 domain-containing protein [Archangium minus]|uniref:DUF11 domain-containing protein n=1 Tax=Archangium minus TaxID=83450 RepID=A0ABY9X7Y9_9BACT|nr:DUF11 domain-containing protein [Archangium minus]
MGSACWESEPEQTSQAPSTLEQSLEQGTSISGRYYKLDVVAMSGKGLVAAVNSANPSVQIINEAPAINDKGQVAFVAKVASGADNLFIGNGSTTLTPTASSTRKYGSGPRINASGQVAAQDSLSTSYWERIWNAPDDNIIVEKSGTKYSSVGAWPAFNDNGQMAFSALRNSVNNVLVTKDSTTHEMAVTWSVRPALANDGRVVFSENLLTGPISLAPYDLSSKETIADSSCFSKLGRFAAISPDGRIIVFYGETTSGCTLLPITDQDTPAGVFASLQLNDGRRKLVRLSGLKVEQVEREGTGDKDGICESGEPCRSAELGYDLDGSSFRFSSYDFNSRIAVAHQPLGLPGIEDDSFVISFVATPEKANSMGTFTDKKGIWTVRGDITGSDEYARVKMSMPMPVIQVGDSIGGEVVSEFSSGNGPAYPEIANARMDLAGKDREQRRGDHRVVFYAKTNSGQFLLVRGEHLDSDEDGLADHWELGGIDFNQDGTVDLALPTLYKTNPFIKDLIVELDYMKDTEAHNHMPHPRRLKAVHDAFAAHGIRLHHFLDDEVTEEEIIGFFNYGSVRTDIPVPSTIKYFSEYKYGDIQNLCGTALLGRATERKLPNCLNILRARNISTRYALFAHTQAHAEATGIAEAGGNDLLIAIYGKDPATHPDVATTFRKASGDGKSCTIDDDVGADQGLKCGTNEIVAATYMHELGHTLGLRHGGSDDLNCKPNYVSIMSYFFQTAGIHPTRKLNYSERELEPLNENQLNENYVITAFPLDIIYWGHTGNAVSGSDKSLPHINWNEDTDKDGKPIIQPAPYPLNINRLDPIGCKDQTLTELRGHDDWSNLHFDFRRNAEGSSSLWGAPVSSENFRIDTFHEVLETLDSDGDGVSNADDNCVMAANPGQEDLNGNGQGDACELVFAPTDLAASITTSPATVHVGDNLTFTLTFTNQSAFPETQVTVLQELPANADFVSVSSAQGQCRRNGLAVGCDLGGLKGGASTTVTVVVRPAGVGTVATSVEVTGVQQDPVAQNNTATTSVNVAP